MRVLARNVELVRFRIDVGITVRRRERRIQGFTLMDGTSGNVDVTVRNATRVHHRRVVAKHFLDRVLDQRRVIAQLLQLIGVFQQGPGAVADQVGGRHVARNEQQVALAYHLIDRQPVAIHFGANHVRNQVIAHVAAPRFDFLHEEILECAARFFTACAFFLGCERIEADFDGLVRPVLEVAVHRGIDTQQFRNHDGRYRPGKICDEIEFGRLDAIEHVFDNRACAPAPTFHGAGRERPAHERPQAPVIGFVHQQHGRFFIALHIAPEQLAGEGAGIGLARVAPEIRIAQDGFDIIVAGIDEAFELGILMYRGAGLYALHHRIGVGSESFIERGQRDPFGERI